MTYLIAAALTILIIQATVPQKCPQCKSATLTYTYGKAKTYCECA